jgi:hypothetical protein
MGFDNISVYWWRKQEHLEKTIKRRTRLDEMTQDVEDTKPPDKMFDMPKNIQVNGTAELSPKSNASKFLKYFVYLLKIVTCEENIYFLVMKRFLMDYSRMKNIVWDYC